MPTVEYIKDPVYSNKTGDSINCIIKFVEVPEELPFTATSYDPEPYGRQIYADLVAGQYGPIGPYVPPAPLTNGTTQEPVVI
jgi:hypothetical protein